MLLSPRALLALLLVALAATPAQGQTERSYPFRPGFVVTAEGDTLRGLVEDRIALDNARLVNFKDVDDAEPRTFYPNSSLGYGFTDGARFVKRTVRPDPDASPRTAFVRVLVEGPRSLYAHAHAPGEDRFYIEGEGFPMEGLYQIEKEVYRDGRYVHQTRRLYAGTLTRAFRDCSEARNAVEDVRYRAHSLAQAVIDYNRCVDPSYSPPALRAETGHSRFIFQPALWVGGGWDQLASRSVDYSGTSLLLGAELAVSVRSPRLALVTGLEYRLNEIAYGGVRPGSYRGGLLALRLGARYTHPLRWASPYVGASYMIGALLGSAESADPLLAAIYRRNLVRDDAESGFALEAGLSRPLTGGIDLLLGLRYLQTSSFSGDPGSPRFERQAMSIHLGIRL